MSKSGGTPSRQERQRSGRQRDQSPDTGRSSERLKKKGQREFSLPDKAEILANLVPEGTSPKNYRDLRPRRLVNDYVKERNRYNNPDGIDLFDDDPLSDFVADDNEVEEDLKRRKKKRSRKQRESSSSEWENSDDAEYSEGSAFSESDDVLDDAVPSEESIDTEDEDGEPAVDVVSDNEDDGKSSSDASSASSTEEFLRKRTRKSLKKIKQKLTSSTWWRTNKKPLSESTRKRRTRRRTGSRDESDDSDEEPSRPAKHKKRRSNVSDDDDDDERLSCRSDNQKRKEGEKRRRPKSGRAPVIDDEDETDDEKETATPADPFAPADQRQEEGENSNGRNSEKHQGEVESMGNSTGEDENKTDNPTSCNENNGESPIVARGKKRKSKQPTVESSDETETEMQTSSIQQKVASGSSPDKDKSLSQDSSGDAVCTARSAKRRIVLEDEDEDSSNVEGNDVIDVDESTDSIKEYCEPNCESANASKELDSSVVEITDLNEDDGIHGDTSRKEAAESCVPSSKDDESNKAGQDEQSQIEHASDKPDKGTEDISDKKSVQVADGTEKEVEGAGQELPETEASKENKPSQEVAERESEQAKGEANEIAAENQVGSDECAANAAVESLEAILNEGMHTIGAGTSTPDAHEATVDSTSGDTTDGLNKDATADDTKEDTAQKDEDGYASDDSIVECPVPLKTPPPEITLSSDEEEAAAPATSSSSGTTSATSNAGGFQYGNNTFGHRQGMHPSFGNPSMHSQFQQNNSATSSIAAALSRSSAMINSNPFGQVLGRGGAMRFGMQRTAPVNTLQQQQLGSSGPRMSGPGVSSNQMANVSNQGATGVLNNVIRQSSMLSRSNQSAMPNQHQPAQNPQWRHSWHGQVPSSMNQRQQVPANASGYQSQTFPQAQSRQRMMSGGMSGQQNMSNPNAQLQVSSSQFSGNMNRPAFQNTNTSGATQRFEQFLSHQSRGRMPNTVGQNRQQLWGRTANTISMGSQPANQNSQTMRFSSQVTQMQGNNQRFQQTGRLEILSVSSSKPANQQSNTVRNMPQVSRGSVQPSSFGEHHSVQGNRPAEQRTNFSGNPFSSHGHTNYNQQSYATSNNNQFPQRTSMQSTHQSGFGDGGGFRTSTGNVQQTGFPNRYGMASQISPRGDNQARYPGPGSIGMVPQQTAHFTHNSNANMARLKSIRDRVQQLNQQRQQLRQQRQQHHQQWSGIQQSTLSNSFNQLPQQFPNSIGSSANAVSSQAIRPCGFQNVSMTNIQVQQQQQRQHPQQSIATRSFSTNLSANFPQVGNVSNAQPLLGNVNAAQPQVGNANAAQPQFGNFNSVQSIQGRQSGSQNPAVSLPASANAFQQFPRSKSAMDNFVKEGYDHLHANRETFNKSYNNIRENITAMRNIQEEMRQMVDRSSSSTSSTNEVRVLSQTIISEVSTERVEQPSGDNMLPDINSLQPNGLDIDAAVGGSMLTDINDAVLASIADEPENTDQVGDLGATDIILGDDPLVTPEEGELLISPPRAVAFGDPVSSDDCSIISE